MKNEPVTEPTRKLGRRPFLNARNRVKMQPFGASDADYARYAEAAALVGKSTSQFIRDCVNPVVDKILAEQK